MRRCRNVETVLQVLVVLQVLQVLAVSQVLQVLLVSQVSAVSVSPFDIRSNRFRPATLVGNVQIDCLFAILRRFSFKFDKKIATCKNRRSPQFCTPKISR